MATESFQIGDLVWAKMKGYPPWPARIVEPLPDAKSPKSKKAQFVYFFGSKNFAWILKENITPHSESMLNAKRNSDPYQKAVDELIAFSKSNQENKLTPSKKIIMKEKKETLPSVGWDSHMEIVPKKELKKEKNKKSPPSPRKSTRMAKEYQPKVVPESKKVVQKRFLDKEEPSKCTSPKIQKLMLNKDPHGSNVASSSAWNDGCTSKKVVRKRCLDIKVKGSRKCASPKNQKPMLNKDPHGSNVASSSMWNEKQGNCSDFIAHVMPTTKKIGFIGLGHIGKAVVRKLLISGHDVTVWNKRTYKCNVFVEMGAKKAQSPAELIMACDIIFCSVSDPEASKAIVFGDRGILKGLCEAEKIGSVDKGYVEMTSIDPETSQEIHEIVAKKGCKYLEAPIYGNSSKALEGTLLILASGNRDLFLECETCFHVIAKHAYFISCCVGFGSKLSLLLSMLSGDVYVAIAEALVLAKRMGLPESIFMTILSEGPLQCENIIEMSKKMIESNYETVTPLKHVQKDLNLSLALANQFSQPMPVTAAANEVYKHAKLFQYSEFDVSAVCEGIRH